MNHPAITLCTLAAVLCAAPGTARAQRQLQPAVTLGLVSQDGPLGGQSGPGVGLALPLFLTRNLALVPGLDLARLHKGAEVALCLRVEGGGCLGRPESETMVAGSLVAELSVGRRVLPFADAGAGWMRSLAPANPGERRQYFTPQVEGGLRARTPVGDASLSLRWRRIDRWRPRDASPEYALLLGFRLGRSR